MSIYKKLLEAIKTNLETEFNVEKENFLLNEVKIMTGGFNGLEDVISFSSNAPCVGIGIRGIPANSRNPGNQLEALAEFSLYLITSDFNKENIGDGALEAYELLEKLQLIIKNGKWGLEEVWQTEEGSIICNNYYSPEFYKNGVVVWEISWKQKVLLGKNRWEEYGEKINELVAIVDIEAEKKETVLIINANKNKPNE